MAVCPVSENGNRKLPLISHKLANGAENDRMQPVACSRSLLFYALSSVWYIPRFRFEDFGFPRVTISISSHTHICFISNVDTVDELTDIRSSRFYQGDSTIFRGYSFRGWEKETGVPCDGFRGNCSLCNTACDQPYLTFRAFIISYHRSPRASTNDVASVHLSSRTVALLDQCRSMFRIALCTIDIDNVHQSTINCRSLTLLPFLQIYTTISFEL